MARNCSKKVQFECEDMAYAAVYRMRDKPNSHLLDAYRCAKCGKWHVGNTTKYKLWFTRKAKKRATRKAKKRAKILVFSIKTLPP